MKSPSLRLRLLVSATVAIFIALALAWGGLSFLFQRHAERREAANLIRSAELLASGVSVDPAGRLQLERQPEDPRFSQMASGLYWQLSTSAGALHSSSLWDQNLRSSGESGGTEWRHVTIKGPFNDHLLVVERIIVPASANVPVLIQVAQNDDEMRQSYAEFGWELAASLGMIWLVLSAAAYIQVELGLHPLGRMRGEMERLRRSPAARLPDNYPREIEPLIGAVNALADARESDLVRARKRAADLAHSLKTPLSVLLAQSRKARAAGAVDAADGLDRAIAAVGAALESELTRARSAAARAAAEHAAQAQVRDVVEGLIGVIERTEHGESMIFDIDIDDTLEAPVAAEDLAEILGALIENAVRHARRRIRIAATRQIDGVQLMVDDDGPGIDQSGIDAALTRGVDLMKLARGMAWGWPLYVI